MKNNSEKNEFGDFLESKFNAFMESKESLFNTYPHLRDICIKEAGIKFIVDKALDEGLSNDKIMDKIVYHLHQSTTELESIIILDRINKV